MQPLMNRRDYDSMAINPKQDPQTSLVMPEDYDSPIFEEVVPEEEEKDKGDSPELKCPFCSSKHTFNPESIGKVKNFVCPGCSSNVPSATVMKNAGNEYVSAIETVSEDETDLVDDLKGSLDTLKKIDKEEDK